MRITSGTSSSPAVLRQKPARAEASAAAPTTDRVTLGSEQPGERKSISLTGGAIVGAIGLAGAALGYYAGNATGIAAGLAGAVVGLSAGATIAARTPGEHIKSGALLGALAGGILGSSLGGTTAGVVTAIAGATLPYGVTVGLASLLSS